MLDYKSLVVGPAERFEMRLRRYVVWSIYLIAFILAAIGMVCILFPDKIVTLIAPRVLESLPAETPTTITSVTTKFQAMVDDIVSRLRIVGILLATMSVLAVAGRRFIVSYVHDAATALPPFVKAQYKRIITWFQTEDKIHLVIFLCIVALAFALRLVFLFQPMRYDEASTFNNYASGPLYIGLANYAAPNNHLFHTLLVHLVTRFGSAEWLIRLPAFLAGMLIIPATYAFGRRLHNKNTALLAAGLVACSSTLIEYSTNARGYTLLTLLFLLAFLLALALIRSRDLMLWSLFVVFSILGFFTIPTMLYGYSAIFVWLAASMWICLKGQERLTQLRRLIIASALVGTFTAVLYFPAYAAWGIEAIVGNKWVVARPWSVFASDIPTMLSSIWSTWNRDIVGPLSAVLACGFVIALFASRRTNKYPVYLLMPVTLIVCTAILIVQRVAPFTRVWLFLFPLYAIFAAWGIIFIIESIARGRAKIIVAYAATAIVCILVSVSVVSSRSIDYTDESLTLRDAEQITLFLSSYLQQDDKVYAVVPSDGPLLYYFGRSHLSSSHLADTADTLSAGRRIVIVVHKVTSSLDDMINLLDELGVSPATYSDPQLVQSYETADLYLITRR